MKKIIFHPLIIALYPVLMLLASNISQVLFVDTVRVFFASIFFAVLCWGVIWVIVGNSKKSALITSLLLILFFSYGHIYSLLQGFSIGSLLIGRTLVLLSTYILILLIGSWLILRNSSLNNANQILNFVSLFLVLIPLFTIISYYLEAEIIRRKQQHVVPVELSNNYYKELPNIYYIILDMHARSDVLREIYGYDDTWFIESLRELGFYVAEESTSNYNSTLQSISSSMNMEYINYLQDIYGVDSDNREPYGILLDQNKVTSELKSKGYKTGSFQTGVYYTEFRDADKYIKLSPDEIRQHQNFWALNSFEGIFIYTTIARILYDLDIVQSEVFIEETIETPYLLHRMTILKTLKHLPDFENELEPYFVFAHIVSPHPPFVFGSNGEEISHNEPFSLSGPGRKNGGAKNVKLYIDQLQYIDGSILSTIKEILRKSEAQSIIIIQSDHGPDSYNGENEIANANMKEEFAILNAYYFPHQQLDLLYSTVTPVNTFRIIFNTFFNENYELLPDKNYYFLYGSSYDFIEATNRVITDPLIP